MLILAKIPSLHSAAILDWIAPPKLSSRSAKFAAAVLSPLPAAVLACREINWISSIMCAPSRRMQSRQGALGQSASNRHNPRGHIALMVGFSRLVSL